MVEPVLTPPHPDPFEALLDKPLTGTFDHPAAQRQSQVLVHIIVDVLAMPMQIGIHGTQGLPSGLRQPGVIALFPQWKTVSLSECGRLQGAPFGGMLEVSSNHHSSLQEPLYDPYYADQGPVDNHLAAFGGATLRLTGPGCAPD